MRVCSLSLGLYDMSDQTKDVRRHYVIAHYSPRASTEYWDPDNTQQWCSFIYSITTESNANSQQDSQKTRETTKTRYKIHVNRKSQNAQERKTFEKHSLINTMPVFIHAPFRPCAWWLGSSRFISSIVKQQGDDSMCRNIRNSHVSSHGTIFGMSPQVLSHRDECQGSQKPTNHLHELNIAFPHESRVIRLDWRSCRLGDQGH